MSNQYGCVDGFYPDGNPCVYYDVPEEKMKELDKMIKELGGYDYTSLNPKPDYFTTEKDFENYYKKTFHAHKIRNQGDNYVNSIREAQEAQAFRNANPYAGGKRKTKKSKGGKKSKKTKKVKNAKKSKKSKKLRGSKKSKTAKKARRH